MEISFQERAIKSVVYIKMNAPDQLLLLEGVCRQLGIVTYHPSLCRPDIAQSHSVCKPESSTKTTLVPCVHVSLVKSLKLPPSQSAVVPVRVEGDLRYADQTMLVEGCSELEKNTCYC